MGDNLEFLDIGTPKEKENINIDSDLGNIKESLKKAKQVWDQIQQQKIKDKKTAFILEELLKLIDNDIILSYIFRFYEIDRKNIYNILVILYPFIGDKFEADLKDLIKDFSHKTDIRTISDFVDFFKKNDTFKGVKTNDKVNLIWEIIKYFNIGDINKVLNDKVGNEKSDFINEVKMTIGKELGECLE